MAMRVIGVIGIALAAGCGRPAETAGMSAGGRTSAAAASPATSASGSAAPSANVRGPRLEVLLRPVADPTPIVHVEVRADIDRGSLKMWRLTDGAADALSNVRASDDAGAIDAQV